MSTEPLLEIWRSEYARDHGMPRLRASLGRVFRLAIRDLAPDVYAFSDDREWSEPTMTAAFELWWHTIAANGRLRDWLAQSGDHRAVQAQASKGARTWTIDQLRRHGTRLERQRYWQAKAVQRVLAGNAVSAGPRRWHHQSLPSQPSMSPRERLMAVAEQLADDELGVREDRGAARATSVIPDSGIATLLEAVLQEARGAVDESDLIFVVAHRTGLRARMIGSGLERTTNASETSTEHAQRLAEPAALDEFAAAERRLLIDQVEPLARLALGGIGDEERRRVQIRTRSDSEAAAGRAAGCSPQTIRAAVDRLSAELDRVLHRCLRRPADRDETTAAWSGVVRILLHEERWTR